jgi:hypothetical protein
MHAAPQIMKKLFRILAAAFLGLLTTSCFEQTAVIRLNKDGSGTITETTLLSEEASGMLEGMAGRDPLAKLADKDAAAAYAKKIGDGVDVEKAGKITRGDRAGVEVIYRFKDINTVKFTMGGSMAEMAKAMAPPGIPQPEQPEQQPASFKYADGVLTLVNPGNKPAPEGEAAPQMPEVSDQQIAMAKGMFKDMKMGFTMEFPDGIAETNATHVEGGTVTMADIDFGKFVEDPAHLKKLMAANEQGPAAAAAAVKDIPGVKVETKEEFTVRLK